LEINQKIFIILCLILTTASLTYTQSSVRVLEQRMGDVQKHIDIINQSILDNMKKTDSLAVKVADLKANQNISFFEKIKLENLLKETQRLNSVQENLLIQQSKLINERTQLFQVLDEQYSAAIDSLFNMIEFSATDAVMKKQWADAASYLEQKQRRLHEDAIVVQPQLVSDVNPSVASNDMPVDIDAKADFYRDRRDKYMTKAHELQTRIKKVKEEGKLRQRMSEMVDDVRLFDQRDEPYSPKTSSSTLPSEFDNSKAGGGGVFNNYEGMTGIGNTTALQEADQFLKYDYRLLPTYDMEEYLGKMEVERRKILSSADSISTVIKMYEEQAEELRRSVQQPKR
jgi:hypothetical protein